jgi:hypothetical protein
MKAMIVAAGVPPAIRHISVTEPAEDCNAEGCSFAYQIASRL